MFNISGFNTKVSLIAIPTFPIGLQITEFADDADPIDVPSLQIADIAMGLNGDMITWSKANPIKINLNVIADSDNDIALSILLQANRVGRGKLSSRDLITMIIAYPNGNIVTLINGSIIEGIPFAPVQTTGRLKTRNYNFSFENIIGV